MRKIELKSGKELTVRKAILYDAEKLVQYKRIIGTESDFLTFGENEIEITVEKEQQNIESIKNKNNSFMAVALIDGEIVGLIILRSGEKVRTKHLGELGLTVRKSHWGLGIGSFLLEFLISWARETGIIKKINLRVRTDNKKAIKLYEKYNFKNEGIISRDFYINGTFYDSVFMGLLVD